MTVPEAAAQWRQAGVSVVPIVAKNQPAVRWKPYQLTLPSLDEVHDWWGNGHEYGIAIICGRVSGGLELTEIEARALSEDNLTKIANAVDFLGCGEAWDKICFGYTQQSPSGGLHLVYRIADHEVPGNTKIAMDRTGKDPLVLCETRGEGGYFVSAPSPGSCHPSGVPWVLATGQYGQVPTITWAERELIHHALRSVLDVAPLPATLPVVAAVASPPLPPLGAGRDAATSTTPGDAWSAVTPWAEILEPEGWTLHSYGMNQEQFWTRPGKSRGDGFSASTDYNGKNGLYIWSTSTGLEIETPLSKLYVYAHYRFGGDMSACAKHLYSRGFGEVSRTIDVTEGELERTVVTVSPTYSLDDTGNSMRLWDRVKDDYRYIEDLKDPLKFQQGKWSREFTGALYREWFALTEEMMREGERTDNQALVKWARASRMQGRVNAAVNMVRHAPGATIGLSDMDNRPDLINLKNGEYCPASNELEPHDREHFMTRMMNATYDPQATCPNWLSFMEKVLPDEATRKYVQRAVGYSLLGNSDERAFFLVYGPSGTGKSQFLSTLEKVFGSYATTAAEGTFRGGQSREGGITNDLHGLRGKRLVTTSETAEDGNFNENLMKRLTGRDEVTSRELYQPNQTWTPECVIWIATNHPPKFNSDDNAIWRRAKLVPFLTEFGRGGETEVRDYARRFLYGEADGILNWIIQGMQDYLVNGLGEPDEIAQASITHREQSDSVIRFLDDMIAEGTLVEEAGAEIRTREMYLLYETWTRTCGERGLGSRRFLNRLSSSGRATYTRVNTGSVWRGLMKPGTHQPALVGAWHQEE